MRMLHTSDWHLGHTLRGEVSREQEHAAFLAWLVSACAREQPDLLVITGDIFDSATPPASAERMWFELLAAARRACPAMDIVAIAGNHDSPARLGASSSVLRELNVHVIGGLPRTTDGIDLDRVIIPVAGGRALVAAVPFLRPIDVDPSHEDPVEAVYAEVVAGLRARRRPTQSVIMLGHLYVAGADTQYLSERRVSIGGVESQPLRLFPRDIDYVALGHIHRSQRVLRETIRYAGAPIALALDESAYKHQVAVVDFADDVVALPVEDPAKPPRTERVREIRSLAIPQTVGIMRVPARGAAPLETVLDALRGMEPRAREADGSFVADTSRPYLEIVVALSSPEPKLRGLVEDALADKRPRLVYLHVEATGDRRALAESVGVARRLAQLDPRDVFSRLWARDYKEPPTSDVRAAFERLLATVQGDMADPRGESSSVAPRSAASADAQRGRPS
ncbi:MAG TPA: exonuclease SbcCD subunit D C-terminal domain-containing protein [Kofleriaceae bacterium]|jgi:exonuclease SbcD